MSKRHLHHVYFRPRDGACTMQLTAEPLPTQAALELITDNIALNPGGKYTMPIVRCVADDDASRAMTAEEQEAVQSCVDALNRDNDVSDVDPVAMRYDD